MRISWDDQERSYSAGVNQGMFYPQNSPGVPWNGLISVTENGDATQDSSYIDGQKYRNRVLPSTYSGTISAFTYPDEFEPYNGLLGNVSGQQRSSFGLSYRTSNEIHLVYNAMISPSSDQYQSIGGGVNPISFSWNFTTLPVDIPEGRPSAHLVITLDDAQPGAVSDLEDMIYGNDEDDPVLPDPATVINIFESHTTVRITDNGDGTWTATGPDNLVSVSGDTFTIISDSAIFIDANTYTIDSL